MTPRLCTVLLLLSCACACEGSDVVPRRLDAGTGHHGDGPHADAQVPAHDAGFDASPPFDAGHDAALPAEDASVVHDAGAHEDASDLDDAGSELDASAYPAPAPKITSPLADSVNGPYVDFEFDALSPFDPASTVWTCDGPEGVFACAPDVTRSFVLDDGNYMFSVTGSDAASRMVTDTRAFSVDATGPTIDVTQAPEGMACTNSRAATAIEFQVSTTVLPIEQHGPVTFLCLFDGGAPADCDLGNGQGRFEWSGLSEGTHTLLIIGYDALDNAGPKNPATAYGAGLAIVLDVAPSACP